MHRSALCFLSLAAVLSFGCGKNAHDEHVGGQCNQSTECENDALTCLSGFKGGYCGALGCLADKDCIAGSRCVTLSGANYCFVECGDKAECNVNRSAENEANCSSNITRVEAGDWKACVPPSAGS